MSRPCVESHYLFFTKVRICKLAMACRRLLHTCAKSSPSGLLSGRIAPAAPKSLACKAPAPTSRLFSSNLGASGSGASLGFSSRLGSRFDSLRFSRRGWIISRQSVVRIALDHSMAMGSSVVANGDVGPTQAVGAETVAKPRRFAVLTTGANFATCCSCHGKFCEILQVFRTEAKLC